jgi:integrase
MNDTISTSPAAAPSRSAWNKGKITGPKPPLRPGNVWAIRAKLQLEKRTRDLAMFNLAIDSKLRGCDLVALNVDDVAPNGYAIDRANVRQSLDDDLRSSGLNPGQRLFPGRGTERSLTTRQYARLVSRWVCDIGLDPRKFATHSMRRTKATLIYRRTGNLRAVQLLLSHTANCPRTSDGSQGPLSIPSEVW